MKFSSRSSLYFDAVLYKNEFKVFRKYVSVIKYSPLHQRVCSPPVFGVENTAFTPIYRGEDVFIKRWQILCNSNTVPIVHVGAMASHLAHLLPHPTFVGLDLRQNVNPPD